MYQYMILKLYQLEYIHNISSYKFMKLFKQTNNRYTKTDLFCGKKWTCLKALKKGCGRHAAKDLYKKVKVGKCSSIKLIQVNIRVHGQLSMEVSCSCASFMDESLLVKHVLKKSCLFE